MDPRVEFVLTAIAVMTICAALYKINDKYDLGYGDQGPTARSLEHSTLRLAYRAHANDGFRDECLPLSPIITRQLVEKWSAADSNARISIPARCLTDLSARSAYVSTYLMRGELPLMRDHFTSRNTILDSDHRYCYSDDIICIPIAQLARYFDYNPNMVIHIM